VGPCAGSTPFFFHAGTVIRVGGGRTVSAGAMWTRQPTGWLPWETIMVLTHAATAATVFIVCVSLRACLKGKLVTILSAGFYAMLESVRNIAMKLPENHRMGCFVFGEQ